MPDDSTLWYFYNWLQETGILDAVFQLVLKVLAARDMIVARGTLIDATIKPA